MAILEQKVSRPRVAMHQHGRAIGIGQIGAQPGQRKVDQRVGAAGFGIHRGPDIQFGAHTIRNAGPGHQARNLALGKAGAVQLGDGLNKFARDHRPLCLDLQRPVVGPPRLQFGQDGLMIRVNGKQPRRRHLGCVQRPIDARLAPDCIGLGRGRARRLIAQIDFAHCIPCPRLHRPGPAAVAARDPLPGCHRKAGHLFNPGTQVALGSLGPSGFAAVAFLPLCCRSTHALPPTRMCGQHKLRSRASQTKY